MFKRRIMGLATIFGILYTVFIPMFIIYQTASMLFHGLSGGGSSVEHQSNQLDLVLEQSPINLIIWASLIFVVIYFLIHVVRNDNIKTGVKWLYVLLTFIIGGFIVIYIYWLKYMKLENIDPTTKLEGGSQDL